MIKIDIVNRTNLTFLAKGYLDNLFPKGKRNEVFYDYNDNNEIKSIFFANEEYYYSLIKSLNSKLPDFGLSNASKEWLSLYSALNNYSVIEDIDYGDLELYDITEKGEGLININIDFLNNKVNKNDHFLKNVKRIYPGYSVSYAGNRNCVIIKFDLDPVNVFKFDLLPIMKLLDYTNQNLKKINFYNDPSRNYTTVTIEV